MIYLLDTNHDRYFLDRTVNTIFSLEPGGNIRQYPGNYSIYLDYKKAEEDAEKIGATSQKSAKPSDQPVVATTTTKARKLSYKEKREFETLEAQIPQMEAEKVEIEKTLHRNPPDGFSAVEKLLARMAELEHTIETSTERWLELAELAAE